MRIVIDGERRAKESAEKRAVAAESELFALGIQVQALKERLKLAEVCVEVARIYSSRSVELRRALAAFDAVPGDVSPKGAPFDEPTNGVVGKEPDTRPRYASGEVPMVGDVVTNDSGNHAPVTGIDDDGNPQVNGVCTVHLASDLTLVRRAAPPAPDLLASAVVLLREHAYDQRVIDFLADFDKGGV
jgi:hypothetical protein